jgi:UDP-GlcNAc3NAcA epimerase
LLVVSIVGARPQFIKAAPISRVLRLQHQELLIHTGQHYDETMSALFFQELGLPEPDHNLGVGSGSHGQQTGLMTIRIEEVLSDVRPDWVMLYGDTNSTLAGALAAAKLQMPIAHVEAGLRSFNRKMPEEINRVLTDHVSDLLLCPSETAVANLAKEGITRGTRLVGDVMADALYQAVENEKVKTEMLQGLNLRERSYLLATLHRAENTDDPGRLSGILSAFGMAEETVVFPLHPRTRKVLESGTSTPKLPSNVRIIEPVGYLEMVQLTKAARIVLTDSGGLQKECYWLSVPCITLRDETEWVETVQAGWNMLTGASCENILEAIHSFKPPEEHPTLYGDGFAALRIVRAMEAASLQEAMIR